MNLLRAIVEAIAELLLVLPLWLIYRKRPNGRLALLFAVFFVLNKTLLWLPLLYKQLNPLGGTWNWSGKIYALIGSAVFYALTRRQFAEQDFITLRQQPGSLRPVLLTTGVVVLLVLVSSFNDTRPFSSEKLAFQLTMPGLDEEFAFRGILLGLLATALVPQIRIGRLSLGHPGIWLTALLFGLVHGFQLTRHWGIEVNWGAVVGTGTFGWIWGWMTLRSRSILMPIILHNLANSVPLLVSMVVK